MEVFGLVRDLKKLEVYVHVDFDRDRLSLAGCWREFVFGDRLDCLLIQG